MPKTLFLDSDTGLATVTERLPCRGPQSCSVWVPVAGWLHCLAQLLDSEHESNYTGYINIRDRLNREFKQVMAALYQSVSVRKPSESIATSSAASGALLGFLCQ